MKPLTKSEGLVDFKENYIFEIEKNMPQNGIKKFYIKLREKYNYKENVSDLYRRIINYQIETFGKTLEEMIEIPDREECYKRNRYMNKVKYLRLKGRKEDENKQINRKEK